MIKQPGVLDWALQEWTEKGAGPLATGVTGTAFLSYSSVPQDRQDTLESRILKLIDSHPTLANTGQAKQLEMQKKLLLNEKEADIQYNFGPIGVNPAAGDNVADFFNHDDPGGYAGIVTVLTHSFSRGSIHSNNSDPSVHPIIDPQNMSHPIDLEIMTDGLLFTQKISEAAPLASLLKTNEVGDGKKIQPAFKVPGRLTKDDAVRIVREASVTSFHPVGTCSMGLREEGGVVDSRLRVHGVEGLRVCDSSVVPLNVRGNIASAVYAVAERGSDLILGDRMGKEGPNS